MDSYRRLSKYIGIFYLLLMVAWLGGCANKKDLKDIQDPFYEQWRVKAEEAKGNSPVEPPPVDEEPFEIVSQDPAAREAFAAPRPLPNRKISMKMNNIDPPPWPAHAAERRIKTLFSTKKLPEKLISTSTRRPGTRCF